MSATEIKLYWQLGPVVALRVECDRPVTAEELRSFADVVEKIEDFRGEVAADYAGTDGES